MTKFTAFFQTTASAAVTADVPDDVAAQGAEAISEWIWEHGELPTPGAQASGWGQPWSLDLGEWEIESHADGQHEGLAYVMDEDGNEITD
ncbi:hypothetical protein [Streptacidiphilus cavernicola]|uniref:PepSY domain-containing protein n=1 Tax=Streptacidiphilus cavernicola TaxID=3342716 RepID=A0ABV6W468_9ACTN